jgi:hypothetical protein
MLSLKIKSNSSGLQALKKRIAKLNTNQPHVRVGLMADGKPRTDGSDLTNAEIGAVHEYGAPDAGIPTRPWLRPGVAKNSKAYQDAIAKALGSELEGQPALTKALGLIGAKAAADVKNFVTQGPEITPTNAASTKKRKEAKTRKGSKGKTRTLVDTAQMIRGVTWKVETGAKKGSK